MITANSKLSGNTQTETEKLADTLRLVLKTLAADHGERLTAVHIGNAMRTERNRYMHPSYSAKRSAQFRRTLQPILEQCRFSDDDCYVIWSIIHKGTY